MQILSNHLAEIIILLTRRTDLYPLIKTTDPASGGMWCHADTMALHLQRLATGYTSHEIKDGIDVVNLIVHPHRFGLTSAKEHADLVKKIAMVVAYYCKGTIGEVTDSDIPGIRIIEIIDDNDLQAIVDLRENIWAAYCLEEYLAKRPKPDDELLQDLYERKAVTQTYLAMYTGYGREYEDDDYSETKAMAAVELRGAIDIAGKMGESVADDALVTYAHRMMDYKLLRSRNKGRGGWHRDDCSIDDLQRLMMEHIEKGDMMDVAIFAAMIDAKRASSGLENKRGGSESGSAKCA